MELFGGRVAGFDEKLVAGLRVEEPLVPAAVRWHPAVLAATALNNWAVAPSRTATGSAMLANDPHLEINRLPCVWYEAALEGPDGWSAGASVPGIPAILAGRNAAVAWGPTYACADVIDSWVEDCRDGCFRRELDGAERWEPFESREAVIDRRGGAPLQCASSATCMERSMATRRWPAGTWRHAGPGGMVAPGPSPRRWSSRARGTQPRWGRC